MKNLPSLLVGLFYAITSFCQTGEFKVYSNGLIYSEQSMAKLSHIVDSLNLKFKVCDYNKVFYAKSQTIGNVVRLSEGNIKGALQDINNAISLDAFLVKYPKATVERNALVIRSRYENYKNEEIVEISHFDVKSDYGLSIESTDLALYKKDVAGTWIVEHHKKTEYSKESLEAFYFPKNFESAPIPRKYCIMIGYSDCLIDTNTTKFKDEVEDGWVELPKNWASLSQKKKAELLDKMRSTRVVGGCSMDSRPREHAVNIALLSAETYNWEVFLKAHLDIMNDRFDRMSDGSYAWGQRNTYIKELEELNINVPDLLLGISFRMENPAHNHYFGSIGRLGRALAETKNKDEIEQTILSIISDTNLDLYNRLLFYFLFKNYTYYQKDEAVKKESNAKLKTAAQTLPDFINTKWKEK